MRNLYFTLSAIIIIIVGCRPGEDYSFKPGARWPDNNEVHINAHGGGIIYHDGKYYWFGQHMVEGEKGNSAWVGVHCYSSGDLYQWKDEGIALRVEEEIASEITAGCLLERPKVIFNRNTEKFVMWFHLERKDLGYKDARSGVAVSDRITGPYTYVRSERPDKGNWPVNVGEFHKANEFAGQEIQFTGGDDLPVYCDSLNILGRDHNDGQMARDMNFFVDDDGKAYHVYASEENSTLHISLLSEDYLSHSGKYTRAFICRYMEAPVIFKRDGKYYFIGSGCTGWHPNAARYAVADSIFGPWTEMGNPCTGPDSALTFHSQSTCVLKVAGKEDAFIFMADRWTPENAIDGRYIWLPVIFDGDRINLKWFDEWDLGLFDQLRFRTQ
jgi:hypothetical protein